MIPEVIEWSDPPKSKAGRPQKYGAIRDQLDARPGEWAQVLSDADPADVNRVRAAIAHRGRPYQASQRANGDGTSDLWIRRVEQ